MAAAAAYDNTGCSGFCGQVPDRYQAEAGNGPSAAGADGGAPLDGGSGTTTEASAGASNAPCNGHPCGLVIQPRWRGTCG